MGGKFNLMIDASDLTDKMNTIREVLSDDGFKRLMERTFREVAKKDRTIIYKAVKQDYVVKQGWAYQSIDSAKITVGNGVSCIIPLHGERGHIGQTFPATGSRRGWHIRSRYKVKAKIVTANVSVLPDEMEFGFPPFRNMPSSLGKVAFTRKGKGRHPIVSVAGLAFPQMPLNRSEDKTADGLLEYAMDRLDHNFGFMFFKG